jgi:hypothetical protein
MNYPNYYPGRNGPGPMVQPPGYVAEYGAASGASKGFFETRGRKRMNIVSIAMSLFLPWAIFSVTFAVMSFSLHYQQPAFAFCIVGLCFVVVAWSGFYAFDETRKKVAGVGKEPTWYIFIFLTLLLAWCTGIVCGDYNFFKNLQPFYDVTNLNTYPQVDPSKFRGQQLMDAGRIVFSPDSKLDLRRSLGFKNLELYCVAPITIGDENTTYKTLQTYDFWAVGVNCCSGNNADFHCGEFNNPRAHAGLRLMRDDQRAFFRLAVQQAEAAYNIKAVHPLFFYWMQDPIDEVNAYQDEGFKFYLLGMFSYFALQLFLVVCAVVVFSKLGQL